MSIDSSERQANAAVTSPHYLATLEGKKILEVGGNAIEAAVVMGACLSVLYPHFTGIGGDAFLLIADGEGNATSLSGIGQCAQQLPELQNGIPARGGASCLTTAATVDAFGTALQLSANKYGGSRSWDQILEPAINIADRGFPLSKSQNFWMSFRENEIEKIKDVYRIFGQPGSYDEGQTIKQPELAESLKLLALNGYRDFYEGELATRIVDGLRKAGSPICLNDLRQTRCRIEKPLELPYRDGYLLGHRPPTQGLTTLEIMGILRNFDLARISEGSALFYHLIVEAVKLAFLDRNALIGDPDFSDVPTSMVLGSDNLSGLARKININCARPWPEVFKIADTVFLAATDKTGLSVSMLQTIYYDWGSGVSVGDTGIFWHNRGSAFSLEPGHPNYIQPRKRPFHTLNPGIFMKNGRPKLLYGAQGADGQPQTLATLLTRMIDYGLDPKKALSRPRFLLGRTFSDSRDTLKIERNVGEDVLRDLSRRHHDITLIDALSPLAGMAGAIRIDSESGAVSAAHDPRGDGVAMLVFD